MRRLLCICIVITGCAPDGLVIDAWQLRADGRDLGAVTLPSDLSSRVGSARRYTLHTEITLPADLRGRDLTLGLGFIGGPAQARANGAEALPLNYRLVLANTRGWRIPAPDGERLAIEITVEHTSWFATYFGGAPVLSTHPGGALGHRVRMFFNVVCPMLAICTLLVLSVINGFSWLLDRRRREYGWFAAMTLMVLPFELGNLGLMLPVFGELHVAASFGCATAAAILSVFFVHTTLGLDPPPRPFRWLIVPMLLVAGIAHDPRSGARAVLIATLVISTPCILNNVARVARVVWRPGERNRTSALLSLLGWLAMLASIGVDALMAVQRSDTVAGLLGNPIGLAVFALFSALALAHEQTAQVRRTQQLNAELRHQLVERSRQLVDALVRVGVGDPRSALVGPGATLANRYRILRALGSGGMGRVFECVRLSDERPFALKLLSGQPRPESLARFAREAAIAADLEHPNLVAVHDVGFSDEGVLFMVMDLVTGSSLDRRREKFGDPLWALPILRQVSLGMAALHARGVIHRDLKPANILVSDDGGIKIADFGISRLKAGKRDDGSSDRETARMTRPGFLAGTPMYMAPELARGFDDAQPSADMFSFGVLAYQLLSGKMPFDAAPVLAAMDGRAMPTPLPLGGRCEIAPEIARFVDDCLAFDPVKRPRAAQALRILRRRA